MVLALVMAGSAMLVFDVVLTRTAGWTVGIASLLVVTAVWWAFPKLLARGARD